MDLVEVFVDLLEAENLKSKNLADEYPASVPAANQFFHIFPSLQCPFNV
jgi:hypothetical protein